MIHQLSDYITPSITSEVICFAVALLCLTGKGNGYWRCMIMFLLLTSLIEIYGQHLSLEKRGEANNRLYNVFLLTEISFTHWMFYFLLKQAGSGSKFLILSGFLLTLVIYPAEWVENDFTWYCSYTFAILSVLLVIYSHYYYYLLFRSDRYIDLRSSPEFWWVAGNLFFYFGSTVNNVFYEYYPKEFFPFLYYSTGILNCIMYGCWSYSFLCKRWIINN